jgi:hypothetical protein
LEYSERRRHTFMENNEELFFLDPENHKSELMQVIFYVLFSFEIDEILSLFRNFMHKHLGRRSLLVTFKDFCKFMNKIEKSIGSYQTIKVLKLINPRMYSRFNSLELLFGNPQERKPGSKLGSFVLKGFFEYFKYKMNTENEKLYGFRQQKKFDENVWYSDDNLDEPDINSQSEMSNKHFKINIVEDNSDSDENLMEHKPSNTEGKNRISAFQTFYKKSKSSQLNTLVGGGEGTLHSKSQIHNNALSSENCLEYNIYSDESSQESNRNLNYKPTMRSLNSNKLPQTKSFLKQSQRIDELPGNLGFKDFSEKLNHNKSFNAPSQINDIEPIMEENLENEFPTQMESTPRKKPKIKLESAFAEEYLDILKSLPFLLCYFFLDLTFASVERKRQFESQNIFKNRQQMMAAVCLSAQVVLSKSKVEDTMTLLDLENLLFVYKNTFAPNITETQSKLIVEDFKSQQKNLSAHRFSVKYVLEHLTCMLGYIEGNNSIEKKIKTIHKKVKKNSYEGGYFPNHFKGDAQSRNSDLVGGRSPFEKYANEQKQKILTGMYGVMEEEEEQIVDHLQVNSIHDNLVWRLCHFLYHKKIYWITYEIRKNLLVFLDFKKKSKRGKETKIKKVFHALADALAAIFPHSHEFTIFKVLTIRVGS